MRARRVLPRAAGRLGLGTLATLGLGGFTFGLIGGLA